MAWREAIVEVRGRRSDGNLNICTGFFISDQLVLTVRHGVQEGGIDLTAIWIRSHHTNNGEQSDFEAKLVAKGDIHDFAILLVKTGYAPQLIGLNNKFPKSGARCATRGFPEGAKINAKRAAISIFGVAHPPVPGEDFFQFDINLDAEENWQWGGLSGAPIVIEDGEITPTALGVVRAARKALGKSRHFEIIPAKSILACPQYCSAIAVHNHQLIEAARISRLLSALAAGKSGKRLKNESGHELWYRQEEATLLQAGLISGPDNNQTPLCVEIVKLVNQSGGFKYLY